MRAIVGTATILAACLLPAARGQNTATILAVLNPVTMDGRLAPGCQAVMFGANLDSTAGGVTVGGQNAYSLKISQTQRLFMIPIGVPLGAATVQIGGSAPFAINLTQYAPTLSISNSVDESVANSGAIPVLSPVSAASPAIPGDYVILYGTGWAAANASTVATVAVGQQVLTAIYAGPSNPQAYYGFDQINFQLPAKIAGGNLPVTAIIGGVTSNTVNLPVGPLASPPFVASVNTAGGAPYVAPNGWIEIKGANLAPAGVSANGVVWSDAPEFAAGRMPTSLGGVSVKVNGEPAYVYYVSPTQVNALLPLDLSAGPAAVVVSHSAGVSNSLVATSRAVAPSFLLLGATQYVAAQHLDYSLLGPASMSVPGYTFTPAKPGETIALYATGFGLPVTPLVSGAASQSGALPSLPSIQIGGVSASTRFAGVIGPGLYQINVDVPATVPNGDNLVTASFSNTATIFGPIIAVQK